MTDIALARKDACLATVHTILTDLTDDTRLIDAAQHVADYMADDLEGTIREFDAALLAVAALSGVNRTIREWNDADGNTIDAKRAADFLIRERMNDYN